ncbi:hypothetical protein QAD02_004430, partial [Eretmocerus hayati]
MQFLVLFCVGIFVEAVQGVSTPVEELHKNADWDEVCKSLMDMESVNADFNHLVQEFESSPIWQYPTEQSLYQCSYQQNHNRMQYGSHSSGSAGANLNRRNTPFTSNECQLLSDIESHKTDLNNYFEEFQSTRGYIDHTLEQVSHCGVSPDDSSSHQVSHDDPPLKPDWAEIFKRISELRRHRQGLNRLLKELTQASFPMNRILVEQRQCNPGPSYVYHRGHVLTVGDVSRVSSEIEQIIQLFSDILSEMVDTEELFHFIGLISGQSCSQTNP